MSDNVEVPDGSEQLDQLQQEETLLDRGVSDVLDEGYVAPDGWSVAQGFGNTPEEAREGEPLDLKLAAEQPETVKDETPWNPDPAEKREVGGRRAGRLVAVGAGIGVEDTEPESLAEDVGIDGGAASAEEAAMHIIEETDESTDE